MLSHAEISDRLEIQQLIVDYSTAIDTRRFDDLDAVFTQDAYIDYTALGGIEGHYPGGEGLAGRGAAELSRCTPTCWAISRSASTEIPRRRGPSASTRWCSAVTRGEGEPSDVLRALVRRPIPPYRAGLADDPPGGDEVLPEDPVTARVGEFLTSGLVLAQWAAVRRATHRYRGACSAVTHARQNRIRASRPNRRIAA